MLRKHRLRALQRRAAPAAGPRAAVSWPRPPPPGCPSGLREVGPAWSLPAAEPEAPLRGAAHFLARKRARGENRNWLGGKAGPDSAPALLSGPPAGTRAVCVVLMSEMM